MTHGEHWIAGKLSQQVPATFYSVNPRTREQGSIGFSDATGAEIDRACAAAREAFAVTRTYSAARLADFLDAVAAKIESHKDDMIATADRETALGEARLTGELGRTTGQLRAFAGLLREGSYVGAIIDSALPDRKPAPRQDIRRMLHPIGPVAVFAASNFPFAFSVCGGDTASAWAAGCPVVVKAHPGHPETAQLFAQAVTEALSDSGFPAGFFSLLHGTGYEVGTRLVQHEAISTVGFTGSFGGGMALYKAAAQRHQPIPVYAEMGSVNPTIITQKTLETRGEALAEGLVNSVLLGAGQFCTNPGLVLMQDSAEARSFVHMIAEKVSARTPQVLLNAQILAGLEKSIALTTGASAVTVVTGGQPANEPGYCFQNTVLQTNGRDFLAQPGLAREHFGPVTLLVLCSDRDEWMHVLAALEGQLTASVHGEPDEAVELVDVLGLLREKAGRVIWNGFPTGVEVVYAQQHGGPFPATTAPATTSVGLTAVARFLRPVAYQNMPDALLPDALKMNNPLGIWRIVNGELTRATG
ncbi:MAG: aldehyde dehydrogenase (NADP(+)) [Pleurocapsa minor GSE-CHR-MK-17-07R]|jgi:NADP-dependent aldehyde dehydrogenase|nr:aldehyde dehydrogenase (NADP(+)) [Pleurocapsa minor GSE-CHR-MK 17-07R]